MTKIRKERDKDREYPGNTMNVYQATTNEDSIRSLLPIRGLIIVEVFRD